MMIVTGANGFIGSVLAWELNQKGHKDIIAVDSVPLSERNLLKKRTYQQFLLKNQLLDFLKSDTAQSITWIFHMGACSSTTEKNWDFLKENNLEYTQKLWNWCADHRKNFIYASSAATYGAGENGFDDQTNPEKLKSLNLYGESKLLFDRWALTQKKQPPLWYGLKFFNVYGPNEYHKGSMSSVAYKAFHQIQDTHELGLFKSYKPDYADGEQKRDFVYVKDVTRWMYELTTRKPQSGIYNMGFGKAQTWLDLAHGVFAAMNQTPKIRWLEMPEDLKNQYQYFTEAKMDHWLKQGMSAPEWSVQAGIKDYIQNYLQKQDPQL